MGSGITKMKKIFIGLTIFVFIFFLIGFFFSKKETAFKIIKKNQEQKTSTPSWETSLPDTNKNSNFTYILELEKKINEEVEKLTEKVKPDEEKGLNDYYNELNKILKKFKPPEGVKEIDSQILIDISQDLSKINPPPLFYSSHLELIRTYYKLGVTLKEFSDTNDPTKKILLYNLIKATLEKIKF